MSSTGAREDTLLARPFVLHTDGMDMPPRLLEIPEPPRALKTRGAWPPAKTRFLAVVGSRAQTPYGRQACESLIAGLAGYPVSIVSGLALGTDACAHKAALSAGLHTVAVLGSGIDDASIYPRTNFGLAKDILAAGGLLVSEKQDGYKPQLHDFPKRNRIVVGLSHAVLVIEAGPKSGTLITARLAGEYNRELMFVPHRIGDAHGFGAHLFSRLGATLVSEPRHILEALGIEAREEGEKAPVALSADEQRVYDLLEEPLPRDELIRASGLAAPDALSALVLLELKGLAKEEFGAWRRR